MMLCRSFAVFALVVAPATLTACGDSGSESDAAPLVSFLQVSGTSPSDSETAVFIDRDISITFDQPLLASAITADSVRVSAAGVDLPVQVSVGGNTISVFAAQMDVSTDYEVLVDRSVTGIDGTSLESDFLFTFTTGETFADGSKPPHDYRPFGSGRFVALVQRSEYMLLGLGQATNTVLVDPMDYNTPPTSGEQLLYQESNPQMVTSRDKRATVASLDDDFHSEVVAVSWASTGVGSLSVFDTNADGTTSEQLTIDLSISANSSGAYRYDVEAADIDADGLDEILVVGVIAGAQASERLGRLWILDDAEGAYAVLFELELKGEFDAGSGFVGLDRVAITEAQLDEDDAAEVLIAYHMNGRDHVGLLAIDDTESGYVELHDDLVVGARKVVPDFGQTDRQIDLGAGDVDADGLDEVVVAYQSYDRPGDECHDAFWLVDDVAESFGLVSQSTVVCSNRDFPMNFADEVHMGDLDGDRLDEFVVWGFPFYYPYLANEPSITQFADAGRCDDEPSLVSSPGDMSAVALGDVNGDFREDILFLKANGAVEVLGCVEHPHFNPNTGELESVTNHFELIDSRTPVANGFDEEAVLIPVNVDHDSVVIRYGAQAPDPNMPLPDPGDPQPTLYQEHSVYFGDNRLIAVVAAPPCADDIGQNTDGCSAGFGTSLGGSISLGMTISNRAGVLLGIEEEVQAGFVFATITVQKAEAEIAAEIEASVSISSTTGISQEITDVAAYGEDLVVFHTTPYDRFTYGVVAHPDGEVLGKLVTVDVPQRSRVLAVTREYYNANNGEQLDVDDNIFQHTPRDLVSYPTFSEVGGYMLPPNLPLTLVGPVTVNQGSGSKQLTGEITSEGTVGAELTLSIDSMAKICGATVCGGVTSGFSIGASSEISLSSSVIFSSEVGALDSDHFAGEQYDFGLFAYTQPLLDPFGKTMQLFVVVNHWVD